jgi:hypothetical protein
VVFKEKLGSRYVRISIFASCNQNFALHNGAFAMQICSRQAESISGKLDLAKDAWPRFHMFHLNVEYNVDQAE